MAFKVHQIHKYVYSLDARVGSAGRLQLWNDLNKKIAMVNFINDTSPVPAPTISPDLNSATVYFKHSALPGLVDMLRNERPVSVTINNQPPGYVFIHTGLEPVGEGESYGLTDSLVVCSSCVPDLLAAKTIGILEAMRRLVIYCGADAPPEVCPITFHLDGDSYCGLYQNGMTGNFQRDASGLGHVCLFDMEKENRSLPFTVENAQKIQDQLLPVHEAMHGWFVGRQHNYLIQEPFCKLTSFIISEASGGPDYCSFFSTTPDDHPDVLMKYLCAIGMNAQRASQVLKQLAESAANEGRALSDAKFADVVTNVIGQDAVPAFRSAGILP